MAVKVMDGDEDGVCALDGVVIVAPLAGVVMLGFREEGDDVWGSI